MIVLFIVLNEGCYCAPPCGCLPAAPGTCPPPRRARRSAATCARKWSPSGRTRPRAASSPSKPPPRSAT
eukprot:1194947-Prorocentrum_minimum.AAC.3